MAPYKGRGLAEGAQVPPVRRSPRRRQPLRDIVVGLADEAQGQPSLKTRFPPAEPRSSSRIGLPSSPRSFSPPDRATEPAVGGCELLSGGLNDACRTARENSEAALEGEACPRSIRRAADWLIGVLLLALAGHVPAPSSGRTPRFARARGPRPRASPTTSPTDRAPIAASSRRRSSATLRERFDLLGSPRWARPAGSFALRGDARGMLRWTWRAMSHA